MKNKAFVTKCEGTQCEIMVMRAEACGSCQACNACHAKPSIYSIENTLGVSEGDWVMVEMDDKQFFRRIGLVYVLPLLFFLGGLFLSLFIQQRLGKNNELISVLAGFFGLALYSLFIRPVDKREGIVPAMHMTYRTSAAERTDDCCTKKQSEMEA